MIGAAVCPLVRCRAVLEHVTDGNGRTIERCPACDRRRRGICRDCPAAVEGEVGKAVRCRRCKRLARRRHEKTYRRDPEVRRRVRVRERNYRRRPDVKARRRAQRAAYYAARRDEILRRKRRYLMTQPPTYLATQRRHNADPVRQAKKRAWALKKYYELHPVRPDPHCTKCNAPIEWDGSGRPRSTCDECCTPAELRRRQRGDNVKHPRAA